MPKVSVLDYKLWLENELKIFQLPIAIKKIIIDNQVAKNLSKINKLHYEINSSQEKSPNLSLSKNYITFHRYSRISSMAAYLKISGMLLLLLVTCLLIWRKQPKQKYSLVFDVPRDLSSRASVVELEEFFSESRLPSSKDAHFIVQTRRLNSPWNNTKRITCVFSTDLFLISKLNFKKRISLLRAFSENIKFVHGVSKKMPQIVGLSRQLIFEKSIAETVIKSKIVDKLYTTNSSYIKQRVIFYFASIEEINSYMFWYSENSFPKSFANFTTSFDYDHFRGINVGEHLVWTSEFSKFLSEYVESPIRQVGSILFYPRNSNSKYDLVTDILIFDVTPQNATSPSDFYFKTNCQRFLKSMIFLQGQLKNKKLIFGIKSKREFSRVNDMEYVSMIKNLRKMSPYWKNIAPSENLYKIIGSSRLVIGIPFTSAVLIAKELGKKCCFYSDFIESNMSNSYNSIPLIYGEGSLVNFVLENLEE